jgi:RimJ/RimL family protein N-acetyltransferase
MRRQRLVLCATPTLGEPLLTNSQVVTLTKFHRTHVTSHSVGLLLLYTLNHPSDSPPGLGLRRVEWRANSRNQPSLNTARRMGFTLEGILRWAWVLPEEKDGNGLDVSRLPDETGVKMGVGRDSAVLAICWDDWLNGGREKVEAIMKRKE